MSIWRNDNFKTSPSRSNAKAENDNKLDNELDAFLDSEVDNENDVEVKDKNFNNAKVIKSGNAYVKLDIRVDSDSRARVRARAESEQDQEQEQSQDFED
jgi:hypothetical protein